MSNQDLGSQRMSPEQHQMENMLNTRERLVAAETHLKSIFKALDRINLSSSDLVESVRKLEHNAIAIMRERQELKEFKRDLQEHIDQRFSAMEKKFDKNESDRREQAADTEKRIDSLEEDKHRRSGASSLIIYLNKVWPLIAAIIGLIVTLAWQYFEKHGGGPS